MQKLKRKPLLPRLVSTLRNLLQPVQSLLDRIPLSLSPPMTAALIVLCLIVLLGIWGCAPRTVRPSLPPQADARPIPDFQGRTYRDALLYLIDVREGFMQCEADKAVIRKVYGHE